MPHPSPANRRAFVRRSTRLQSVPDLPGVRLHLADDVAVASRLAAAELGESLPPGLQRLATYRVRTTIELENVAVKVTSVYTIPGHERLAGPSTLR